MQRAFMCITAVLPRVFGMTISTTLKKNGSSPLTYMIVFAEVGAYLCPSQSVRACGIGQAGVSACVLNKFFFFAKAYRMARDIRICCS